MVFLDQLDSQAFKAKELEIFSKNKNTKLIFAPAGDHRGTAMVERMIQTIKRILAVLDIYPKWSIRIKIKVVELPIYLGPHV